MLKRYNSNLTKNNKKIEYSEYIDLNKYTLNYNKKPNKYKLESICIQDGSYGGGHYYSMCKCDGKWNIYNDTRVSPTNIGNVLNQSPYILFYKII